MPYAKHVLRASSSLVSSACLSRVSNTTTLISRYGQMMAVRRSGRLLAIREYAYKPPRKSLPSRIYNSYLKKSLASDSWEASNNLDDDAGEAMEIVSQNARKLKESLAAPPGKDSLDYYSIKSNLLALLTSLQPSASSEQKIGYTQHKRLLETSVFLLLKEAESSTNSVFSIQEICQVYFILIRNGAHGLVDSNLLPKIFSVIQSSKELTKHQQLETSLEFLKFLDAQQKALEAEKFLSWILSAYGPLTENTFNAALRAVNCPNIKFSCFPLLFSAYHSQGAVPSHEALLYGLTSLKSSRLTTGAQKAAFAAFVKQNVIETQSQHTNVPAFISILETLLEKRDLRGAKSFLELFDSSIDISTMKFSSLTLEKQFIKLILLAHLKYLNVGTDIPSLVARLDTLNGKDLELDFYLALYSEQDSTNLASIFSASASNGLIFSESLFNNAIEILIQNNHGLHELKKLLTLVSEKYEFESDVETYEIFVSSSLASNDVELALQMFLDSLQEGTQWDSDEGVHLKVLDELIVAMCETMSSEVFRVFKVYQQIKIFSKTVGYEAQASLLQLFLSYNYVGDCEKFLEDELGSASRTMPRDSEPKIYDALYSYAKNCSDYKDSWLIYGLSQKYFDCPFEYNLEIMKHFCSLGRPDAALIIFKNMRNKSKTTGSRPPDEAMYSLLFREFGQSGYLQGVTELHTLFKMDTSVEAETFVLNEIMHAYCELDNTQQAVEIWSQISSFPKELGPTNDSYTIMLKLCTKVSIQDVEHMWNKLLESGMDVDDQNYRQYIIANCYHGFYVRALDIAKAMPSKGVEPSKDTLGALYNWTLLANRKEDVSSWASANYSDKWTQLLNDGGLKTYLLDESNPNNDSESHLRHEIGTKLALEGKKLLPDIL